MPTAPAGGMATPAGGGKPASPTKNWPVCCPILHHDIAGEVPAALTGAVRAAYLAYLGLVLCLLWNLMGTVAVLIGVGGDNLTSFLWAGLYVLGGVPGALWLWYRPVYKASISDSALRYALYFAFFLGHLVFCGWSAVAPPILNSWSHTGWYSAYNSIWPRNRGAGIIYYVGAALWSVEFLWSFWTLKHVYSSFRGRGLGVQQAKQEAAAGAIALTASSAV